MTSRRAKPTATEEASSSVPKAYEPVLRAQILERINARSDISDFETLIDSAQKIAVELFLNQAAICLKMQVDYMNRDRPQQDIEAYRIFNITADVMRELTAYDFGVDSNKAIEFLTRQGYEVSDGSPIVGSDTLEG